MDRAFPDRIGADSHDTCGGVDAVYDAAMTRAAPRLPKSVRFTAAPEDGFFTPGRDRGIWRLGATMPELTLRMPAQISGFSVARHADLQARSQTAIRFTKAAKSARQAIALPCVPVVMRDVSVIESYRRIDGKYLLSGAAGSRLRNRYARQHPAEGDDPFTRFSAFVEAARPGCHLPAHDHSALPGDLPIVIECRNRFNYFHFLTETLCQLNVAARLPSGGPILIHHKAGAVAGFTQRFIDALFPDIAARVCFVDRPAHYPVALGLYELDYYIFQAETVDWPLLDEVMPADWPGAGRAMSIKAYTTLEQNLVRAPLLDLRDRALAMLEGRDFDHLPRRVYVARRGQGKRARPMRGEAKLLRQLQKIGFAPVFFEDHTPLEQVALMARAEMVISQHGAGLANLIFAGPDTHVIEIGSTQTAVHRWSDFIPLAHVAGCRYTSFFADFVNDDDETSTGFGPKRLWSISLSDDAIDQIVAFAANALGEKKRRTADPDLMRVATRLNEAREWDGLRRLLAENWDQVQGNATLLVHMANCAADTGDLAAVEKYLDMAWALDASRPVLLERMIRVARRRKDWPRARRLLDTHRDLFPDRDRDFTGQKLSRG